MTYICLILDLQLQLKGITSTQQNLQNQILMNNWRLWNCLACWSFQLRISVHVLLFELLHLGLFCYSVSFSIFGIWQSTWLLLFPGQRRVLSLAADLFRRIGLNSILDHCIWALWRPLYLISIKRKYIALHHLIIWFLWAFLPVYPWAGVLRGEQATSHGVLALSAAIFLTTYRNIHIIQIHSFNPKQKV